MPQSNTQKIIVQVLGHSALLFCLLVGPWWLMLLLLALMIVYQGHWEAAIWAVLYDTLYGIPSLLPVPFFMTGIAIALIILEAVFKPLLLPYTKGDV